MPFGDRSFDMGINIAWFDHACGHDLGPSPYYPNSPGHLTDYPEIIRAYFNDIAQRRIRVVRIWLFELLEGLVFDPSHFHPSQINIKQEYDDDYFIQHNFPLVRGVQPVFFANVNRIMQEAQNFNLEIHWCIWTIANYFKNPHTPPEWAIKKLLEDRNLLGLFILRAINPFVAIIQQYRRNIYAIDLINEPEGYSYNIADYCNRRYVGFNIDPLEPIIQNYINTLGPVFQQAGFKTTVGCTSINTLIEFQRRRSPLDFYQLHLYGNGDIGSSIDQLDKSVIIGECNTNNWYGAPADTSATEEDISHSLTLFLNNAWAKRNKVKGILPWRYGVKTTIGAGRAQTGSQQPIIQSSLDLVHSGEFTDLCEGQGDCNTQKLALRHQFLNEFFNSAISRRNRFWKNGVWQTVRDFSSRF